jgi:hypothetical protein
MPKNNLIDKLRKKGERQARMQAAGLIRVSESKLKLEESVRKKRADDKAKGLKTEFLGGLLTGYQNKCIYYPGGTSFANIRAGGTTHM